MSAVIIVKANIERIQIGLVLDCDARNQFFGGNAF